MEKDSEAVNINLLKEITSRHPSNDSDTIVLVAQTNQEIVGFGLAGVEQFGDDLIESPFLTVNFLTVKNELRSQGIGETIMAKLEDYGRQKGVTVADLIVFERNDKAQKLFNKCGYQFIEHRMAKKL